MVRVIRGVGWTLLVSGAIVLLYVVYLLWFTNFETNAAQRDLARLWEQGVAVPDEPDGAPTPTPREENRFPVPIEEDIEVGDAYAALWFERDGERIVADEVLYVVEGTSLTHLRSGPGHYLDSDRPGGAGNLAIAGHRTTYGAPFWSLDMLTDGDTIHVMDRQGNEWVYAYREQQVVRPTDVWVIGEDPLETGMPTITLTTCHPRGSDRQRLIAFGELIGDPVETTATEGEVDALAET